jgi:molecular chaperone GrpE (heat shock protein)
MNVEMHDELTKLRNNFIEDVKRPYIKGYLQIYDRLDDLFRANNDLPSPELANVMNTVNNIKLNILDILEEFDIELVEPEINSVFNPKELIIPAYFEPRVRC